MVTYRPDWAGEAPFSKFWMRALWLDLGWATEPR